MNIPEETVEELRSLAGVALTYGDQAEALNAICAIAARAIPNADGASLTSFNATGPEASAASSDWAKQLDEMQYVEHEGPCIDAGRTGILFRVRDIEQEGRWPAYMPRAFELGARSMISIPTTVEAKVIGALNVYSRQVDAFGSEEVSLAEIIGGHVSLTSQVATSLYGHRDLAERLQDAMSSRAVIEQAKGILMATLRCDADTAFQRLTEQSQHQNRKLRDLADELVRQQIS